MNVCRLAVAALLVGCGSGSPSQTPTPAAAPPTPSPTTVPAPSAAEPRAEFLDFSRVPNVERVVPACRRVFVAPVRGAVQIGEDRLRIEKGDVLTILHPASPVQVHRESPETLVAFAELPLDEARCRSAGQETRSIVRASSAPLSWGGGGMRAWLDVEGDRAPDAYYGRLEGKLGVPEHQHDGSWEILFAAEAHGTFTLAGQPERIDGRKVVRVPPGTKHSWTPDPGTELVASQIYFPPGPEQRFKKLASDSAGVADGGAGVGAPGPAKKTR